MSCKIGYSIILPCLDELENLKILIKKLFKIFKKKKIQINIIDDSNNDKTKKFFEKNKYKYISYVQRNQPKNLGKSVLLGIKLSKYNNIIVMDSDFNHNPSDIKKILQILKKKSPTIICGSRFFKNGYGNNFYRHWSSLIYCKILNIIIDTNISDLLSGFFYLKKQEINEIPDKIKKEIFNGYGEYYLKLLICFYKRKKKITYFPIIYGKRKFGISKSNFFKMLFAYLYHAIVFNRFYIRND